MTYDEWMKEVDAILEARYALTQDVLPDWLSRDSFEAGMTPEEGAEECLTSAGFYDDEDEFIDEP